MHVKYVSKTLQLYIPSLIIVLKRTIKSNKLPF